jgi:ABC-type lipoprotein export system ATPase subunit
MKNIIVTTKDNVLSLAIDLSKIQGPSKSGKSTVIATTGGNKEIASGIYMGLNVYKKV